MSTESLEVSKRLKNCAQYLDALADFTNCSEETERDLHQWAADIRSIILPQPGEVEEVRDSEELDDGC